MAVTGKGRWIPSAWFTKKTAQAHYDTFDIDGNRSFGNADLAHRAVWRDWFFPLADETEVVRGPLLTPRYVKPNPVPYATLATNLLLTTLAVVAGDPVSAEQVSFPHTLRAPASPAVQVFVAPSRLPLLAAPSAPFAQEDWPNPVRKAVRVQTDIPQVFNRASVVLPFMLEDWQNPTRARVVAQPLHHRPTVDPTAVAAPPFMQEDWPNPVRKVRTVQTDQSPVFDRSVIVVAAPFAQEDWPNPLRRRIKQSVVGVPPFDRPEASASPFAQEDWPNPVRKVRTVQTDQSPVFDRSPVAPPFMQEDWPNPVRKIRTVQTDQSPVFDRSVVAGPAPFAQKEWSNPTRKRVKQSVFGVPPFARPESAAPFAQEEWPNPVRRVRAVQVDLPPAFDRTPLGPSPFAQEDWPNPVRRLLAKEWGSVQPLLYGEFIFVPPSPFSQSEWPNPVRRVMPEEWGAVAPLLYDAFIVVPPKPYNISDWPNPTLPVLPTEWGSFAPINYQAFVDTPLPEPPPTVIIIGGDDAPRKKKPKTKQERRDLFREVEQTVHRLLHPVSEEPTPALAPVVVHAAELDTRLQALRTLAQGQHDLIQRAAELRAEVVALEERHRLDLERDEEEALIWLF